MRRAKSRARSRPEAQDGRQVNRINGYGTNDHDGWRWVGVDLEQIEGNVRELVRFFRGTPVLAVVKADGYGHGIVPVAHRALAAGAAMLGVTSVDEGALLRREGIIAPILLLQPLLPGQAAAAVAENLRVCITDYRGADDLAEAARRAGRKATVHVKVNTGMGRFGADAQQAMDLIRYVKASPELLLEGVFSHLAAADVGDAGRTSEQVRQLRQLQHQVKAQWPREPVMFHLANTAASLLFPDTRFDMVRIGLGCYGIVPDAVQMLGGASSVPGPKLAPAMSLHARIAAVRNVEAGAPIGYAGMYVAGRPTRIAIVAAGYANGVPRALSNRGRALVRGRSVPIVGRVCMNQTFLDLGPDGAGEPGDEVVFLGRQGDERIELQQWCRLLDTIPHDLLCYLGRNEPRIYSSRRTGAW